MSPKIIRRKEGLPAKEDLAQPISEISSTRDGDSSESGELDDGEMIEIDLGACGKMVTKARAKNQDPPSTSYRSPGSIFQHIVPTQIGSDNAKS